MGPPASHRVTRVRWYSGSCVLSSAFIYGTLTLFGLPSQTILLAYLNELLQSSTPKILLPLVWPLSLSLAATQKIDFSFSSSAYLDVSVQRVSHLILFYSYKAAQPLLCAGFPIRKSADLYVFAVPRSLSQLVTSFFGS